MSSDVRLVEELVRRFPAFDDIYESHVFNEGGVLPHVFFWDVTQEVVEAFVAGGDATLDWKAVIQFLEERLVDRDPEVVKVIVTSFLNYLPYPGKVGHDLTDQLGEKMSQYFKNIRPMG